MRDKLLRASTSAAHRAIEHYLNNEHDQFLIQAAISIELLGKARLASIHPSLIVDKDFDSLLHACGSPKHSRRAPSSIKSINATETLKRNIQLEPRLDGLGSRLGILAELRNSVIHIGEMGGHETKEILRAFLKASVLMCEGLKVDQKQYFGDFAAFAAAQLDEASAEVNKLVAEKLAFAMTTFQNRYGALDAEQRENIIRAIDAGYAPAKYEESLTQCPACENRGMLAGAFDVEWEADYDRDGNVENASPVVVLTPSSFECQICGLSLGSRPELHAAGIEKPVSIEDVNPEDFYEHDY